MKKDLPIFDKEFAGRVLLVLVLFAMLTLIVSVYLEAITLPTLGTVTSSAVANLESLDYLWGSEYRRIDVLIQAIILLAASLAVAAQFRHIKKEEV